MNFQNLYVVGLQVNFTFLLELLLHLVNKYLLNNIPIRRKTLC